LPASRPGYDPRLSMGGSMLKVRFIRRGPHGIASL
jgi:hypothetical protein